jgi:heme A synthase
MVIPAVALLFLVVSFFTRVSRGVVWALAVFVTVVAQVLLGMFAHGAPALGMVHGTLALVLFGLALWAGLRVTRTAHAEREPVAVPVPSA